MESHAIIPEQAIDRQILKTIENAIPEIEILTYECEKYYALTNPNTSLENLFEMNRLSNSISQIKKIINEVTHHNADSVSITGLLKLFLQTRFEEIKALPHFSYTKTASHPLTILCVEIAKLLVKILPGEKKTFWEYLIFSIKKNFNLITFEMLDEFDLEQCIICEKNEYVFSVMMLDEYIMADDTNRHKSKWNPYIPIDQKRNGTPISRESFYRLVDHSVESSDYYLAYKMTRKTYKEEIGLALKKFANGLRAGGETHGTGTDEQAGYEAEDAINKFQDFLDEQDKKDKTVREKIESLTDKNGSFTLRWVIDTMLGYNKKDMTCSDTGASRIDSIIQNPDNTAFLFGVNAEKATEILMQKRKIFLDKYNNKTDSFHILTKNINRNDIFYLKFIIMQQAEKYHGEAKKIDNLFLGHRPGTQVLLKAINHALITEHDEYIQLMDTALQIGFCRKDLFDSLIDAPAMILGDIGGNGFYQYYMLIRNDESEKQKIFFNYSVAYLNLLPEDKQKINKFHIFFHLIMKWFKYDFINMVMQLKLNEDIRNITLLALNYLPERNTIPHYENGRTPISLAVAAGWSDVVKFLIQQGVIPTSQDNSFIHKLIASCRNYTIRCVERITNEDKASVNSRNEIVFTNNEYYLRIEFFEIKSQKYCEGIKYSISENVHDDIGEFVRLNGGCLITKKQSYPIYEAAIQSGFDMNGDGSILLKTIRNGDLNLVEALLLYGLKQEKMLPEDCPLVMAVECQDVGMVSLLLNHQPPEAHIDLAISIALEQDNCQIIECILNNLVCNYVLKNADSLVLFLLLEFRDDLISLLQQKKIINMDTIKLPNDFNIYSFAAVEFIQSTLINSDIKRNQNKKQIIFSLHYNNYHLAYCNRKTGEHITRKYDINDCQIRDFINTFNISIGKIRNFLNKTFDTGHLDKLDESFIDLCRLINYLGGCVPIDEKLTEVLLNKQDMSRCLLHAVANGDTQLLTALIKRKIDLNQILDGNKTALSVAMHAEDISMATFLLVHEADPLINSGKEYFLLQATKMNDIPLMSALIAANVDINEMQEGRSALHIAIENRNPKLVRFLLSNKADPNICDQQTSILPPLFHLTFLNNEIIQLLLQYGANVLLRNEKEQSIIEHYGLMNSIYYREISRLFSSAILIKNMIHEVEQSKNVYDTSAVIQMTLFGTNKIHFYSTDDKIRALNTLYQAVVTSADTLNPIHNLIYDELLAILNSDSRIKRVYHTICDAFNVKPRIADDYIECLRSLTEKLQILVVNKDISLETALQIHRLIKFPLKEKLRYWFSEEQIAWFGKKHSELFANETCQILLANKWILPEQLVKIMLGNNDALYIILNTKRDHGLIVLKDKILTVEQIIYLPANKLNVLITEPGLRALKNGLTLQEVDNFNGDLGKEISRRLRPENFIKIEDREESKIQFKK